MLPILMSESAFLDGPLPPELLALLPPSLQGVKRRKKKRKGTKKGKKGGTKKKMVKAGAAGQGETIDDLYEKALNAATSRKGRAAPGGEAEGQGTQQTRKGGKKKKRRRKGKKGSALAVVDPAKHLANSECWGTVNRS
jgi:hypothetical protein